MDVQSRAGATEAEGQGKTDDLATFARSWLFFLAGVIVLTVALMLASFPAGLYTVFGTSISKNYTASSPVHSLNYDIVFSVLNVPLTGTLGGLFGVFLAVYLSFLILAARQGAGFLRALRASVSDGYVALFSNPLAAMIVVLGALSLATDLLDTLQVGAGIPTGNLTGDPFLLLVEFGLAPLLEESAFRLILIGLPVFVMALLLFRTSSPTRVVKVLWRPSAAWDVEEDDEVRHTFEDAGVSVFQGSSPLVRALKPVVYVFLVLSSIIFGYAHFSSGSGWGPGKISEAALAGLALGYLYVKYGFHTNVLLHWTINYVGSIYSFLAMGLWGIPWTSVTGSPLDYLPDVVIIFLLGIPSLLLLVNELLKRVLARRF